MVEKKLSIYQYTNYRQFLADYVLHKKSVAKGFSLEVLARKSENLSRPHLSQIISGRRNLTKSNAILLGRAISFSPQEKDYFLLIVAYAQAKNQDEAAFYLREILRSTKIATNNLQETQYRALESWYYIAIMELARLPDFQENPLWIQRRLKVQLSLNMIKHSLELLFEIQLLIRDANGRVRPAKMQLSSDFDRRNIYIQKYHLSNLDAAKHYLMKDDVDSREFGAVTIPVTRESFLAIKKKLQRFYHELLDEYSSAQGMEVAQINFQLFQVTKTERGENICKG